MNIIIICKASVQISHIYPPERNDYFYKILNFLNG